MSRVVRKPRLSGVVAFAMKVKFTEAHHSRLVAESFITDLARFTLDKVAA